MKNNLLHVIVAAILLAGVLIISCVDEPNVKKERTTYQVDNEFNIEVVTIDGCEYLYGPWGNATVLTHKGNCKNIIHY